MGFFGNLKKILSEFFHRSDFLDAMFTLCYGGMNADGNISSSEILQTFKTISSNDLFKDIFQDDLKRVWEETMDNCKALVEKGKFEDCLQEKCDLLKKFEHNYEIVDCLVWVIAADGKVTDTEVKYFKKICAMLDIKEDYISNKLAAADELKNNKIF